MSKGWKIDSEQQSVNARAIDYLCIHADGRRATVRISDSVRVGYMGDVNAMIFDIANKISPPKPDRTWWSIVARTFDAERNQYEVTARKGDHECWLRLNRQQIGHGTLTEAQLPTMVQARANYALGRRPHVPEEYGDGTRHNLRSALISLRAGDADAIIVPLGFNVDPWCCSACAGSVRACRVCGKEPAPTTEYRVDFRTPRAVDGYTSGGVVGGPLKPGDFVLPTGLSKRITDEWKRTPLPPNHKHAIDPSTGAPFAVHASIDMDPREERKRFTDGVGWARQESGPGIVNVVGISQRVPVSVGYDDMSGDDIAADWRRW